MRSRAVVVAAVLGVALVSGGWLMQAGYDGGSHVVAGAIVRRGCESRRDLLRRHAPGPELYRKAVDGLLLELHDPHSVYLPPDRLASSTRARRAVTRASASRWTCATAGSPSSRRCTGTPAERAGILTGDRIVADRRQADARRGRRTRR